MASVHPEVRAGEETHHPEVFAVNMCVCVYFSLDRCLSYGFTSIPIIFFFLSNMRVNIYYVFPMDDVTS